MDIDKQSWFSRLRAGLTRSARGLSGGLSDILRRGTLDEEMLLSIEELLITSDLGVETAAAVTEKLAATHFDKEVSPAEVRKALAEEIMAILQPVAMPLSIDSSLKPFVILVAGVNGTGKTTTVGKLAQRFRDEGKTVMLVAGDTYRAAAIDQLKILGVKTDSIVMSGAEGADASGLVYDALASARAKRQDVVIIDTAGRLQNKTGLMAELEKIFRVIRRIDANAPHSSLLVLDATTGQNVLSQVEAFRRKCDVTGLIMTKLDGTARGGVLVSVARRFNLPIVAIGVGEGLYDMQPFEARSFAEALTREDEDRS